MRITKATRWRLFLSPLGFLSPPRLCVFAMLSLKLTHFPEDFLTVPIPNRAWAQMENCGKIISCPAPFPSVFIRAIRGQIPLVAASPRNVFSLRQFEKLSANPLPAPDIQLASTHFELFRAISSYFELFRDLCAEKVLLRPLPAIRAGPDGVRARKAW